VKKELRPFHDEISCEVCGRTILKGERTEPYLAPGGQRHVVCDLCRARADHAGWIRESAHGDLPTRAARPESRGALRGLLRRRRPDGSPAGEPVNGAIEPAPAADGHLAQDEHEHEPTDHHLREHSPPRPKDPRHIRAVPTTAEVKVDRALEVFNRSEHHRTIAGITRTLGTPWVTASPAAEAPSEVTIVVAWELSWYRYRVDLGDEHEPVALLEKGEEIDQIEEALRDWNSSTDLDGKLVSGVGSER
jgi:hypothetical protein